MSGCPYNMQTACILNVLMGYISGSYGHPEILIFETLELKMRVARILTATSVAALLSNSIAFAQEVEEQDTERSLNKVIVTATKRAENIQDVPIAITAFDTSTIASERVDDLQEIASRTPSFLIGQNGPTAPELTIRGIGSTDREAGSERSVVVFVDEIYIGRAGASTFDLYDLERIEVLRGPQGSVFGRNVVGGSVNLVTANPDFEFDSNFSATLGSLALVELQGMVTGALSEQSAGRAAFSIKKRDGYYKNRQFGMKTTDNTQTISARGKYLYKPDDDFRALFTLDISQDTVDGISSAVTQGATPDAEWNGHFTTRWGGDAKKPSSDLYVTDNNELGELDRQIYGLSGRADWKQPYGNVTLLGSYRSASFEIVRDLVGVPIAAPNATFVSVDSSTRGFSVGSGMESTAINDEDYTSLSAELRLASPESSESSSTWLVGGYFLSEKTDRAQIRERNLAQVGTTNRSDISRPLFDQSVELTSFAIFANGTFQFAEDRAGLTVGARYSSDEKSFDLEVKDTLSSAKRTEISTAISTANITFNPSQAVFKASASKTFSKFTPEVTLDYKINDDVLVYGKVSTGYKSGGYAGLAPTKAIAEKPFSEETVLNKEIGIKSDLFDYRLMLNANLYEMDFDELQLRDRQLFVPGDETTAVVLITNAASAKIRGLEVDFIAKPSDELDIFGGLSLLESEITEVGAESTITVGTELPKAPKTSLSLSFDYKMPISGSGDFSFGAGLQHVGEHFFDIGEVPAGTEPAYTLFDIRMSFAPENANWLLSLWGKNLTDEYYRTQVQSAIGKDLAIISRLGEPLTWGLTYTLRR